MPEPDWLLTENKIRVALGREMRRAREAAGLTRPKFVELLPFDGSVHTLLNWELGHRAISFARLVEVARLLGHTAPQLLQRALAKAEAIQTQYVDIDIAALRKDSTAKYVMLRDWAERKRATLSEDTQIVRLHHTVIREWAVLLNVKLIDLVRYLDAKASLAPVIKDLKEDEFG